MKLQPLQGDFKPMNKNLLFLGTVLFSTAYCFAVFGADAAVEKKATQKADSKPKAVLVADTADAKEDKTKQMVERSFDKNDPFAFPYAFYDVTNPNTRIGSVNSKDPDRYSIMLYMPVHGVVVEMPLQRSWEFCIVEDSEKQSAITPESGRKGTFEDIEVDDYVIWFDSTDDETQIDMNTIFILR